MMATPRKISAVAVETRMNSPARYATITEISPRNLPRVYAPRTDRSRRIIGRMRKRDRIAGSE
jgi:hypothetical protein